MALSEGQWDQVSTAMAMLRGMGCAVCIFTPNDVESAHDNREDNEASDDTPGMTMEESADWMTRHRTSIEEGMSTFGNGYIGDHLDSPAE